MNFKIHRGTKEIGGSCVEIWTDKARLVLDIGMPLVDDDGLPFDEKGIENLSRDELIQKKILPDIPSLYKEGSDTALIISHSHKDHHGLMKYIHLSCTVWMGEPTYCIIKKTCEFLGGEWALKNVCHFKHTESFEIGDIKIKPYLVDHSAIDAHAFLIQAGAKSLFYSGDFRNHGRKGKLYDFMLSDVPKEIDYMLLEGSSIGRTDDRFPTEAALEEDFVQTFKKTKGINLVYVSGQNIDRLVTIYRACKKCGKIFLVDFYTANILRTANEKSSDKIPFPSKNGFHELFAYYPYFLTKIVNERGKAEEYIEPFKEKEFSLFCIDKMAGRIVMLVRPHVQADLERHLHHYDDGCFIYSMYSSYKKDYKNKKLLDFISTKGMSIIDIHTSGHADLPTLKKMVETIKPKHLVPIHTFEGDKYAELFPDVNVQRVGDGEIIDL